MDASELEALVERLVANPHDQEALAYAHAQGETDPEGYAAFLERVGSASLDPAYAAHWLSESANVWLATLGDTHRAARVLMDAIERDPTHRASAERLAGLYRDAGDTKAVAALLDRRVKALAPLADDPEIAAELGAMHEELAQLFGPEGLQQPRKALEHWQRAAAINPHNAYAVFSARELLKAEERYAEAAELYAVELALETDPDRRLALLRDEASIRKLAGDLRGATEALLKAREIDHNDPALRQEYASSILERVQAGEEVGADEREAAREELLALASAFGGEHALAYSSAALDLDPGSDAALSLLRDVAVSLGQDEVLIERYQAYLRLAPQGALADEARAAVGAPADEPPQHQPVPAAVPSEGGGLSSIEAQLGLAAQPTPHSAPAQAEEPAEAARSEAPVETPPAPPPARVLSEERQSAPVHEPEEEPAPQRRASTDHLQQLVDAAHALAAKGRKPEAYTKYKEVLESEPSHTEALAWVEDYLRSKRDYPQLRDVLLASVRAVGSRESVESKKERLREVAGLCEGNLRDTDGAVAAWRQLIALDRSDESARLALSRLLERSQRWDDLANLLEQEATIESDIESKISLEKKLARLQEDKRKDLVGAAEGWVRIARLTPEDEAPVATAAKLFERAERVDLAVEVLAEHAPLVDDRGAKGSLLERLGQLRETLGQLEPAGDAFMEAAEHLGTITLWTEAERVYAASQAWQKAAEAAEQHGQVSGEAKVHAQALKRAADHLSAATLDDQALDKLEEAGNLDPSHDGYASELDQRLEARGQIDRLIAFLAQRADRVLDRDTRVAARRRAAQLATAQQNDADFAREAWLKVLEDGDDQEALEHLVEDASGRGDHTEATSLLRRLGNHASSKTDKAAIALREAGILADGVGDVDAALARYDEVLAELDPSSRAALQAIADLQEGRGKLEEATVALERELLLAQEADERGHLARRLAGLYDRLDDAEKAIVALDAVRAADPEDFDALRRLAELCEATKRWDRVAVLLAELIEVEGDEAESARMTMRLAEILADELERGEEALAALTELADQGHAEVREAYVSLGDRLGHKGMVAQKLGEWWFDARQTPERQQALRGAFERFAEVKRGPDAIRIGIELTRTKSADRELASTLESLSVEAGDTNALTIAHDLLGRELSGIERGEELVRQAEVKAKANVAKQEALEHGEEGLTSVPPLEAEPLLARLAALAPRPVEVVDLYERQISRSKQPAERAQALARAAQVAAAHNQSDRARGFYDLALAGAPQTETLELLETTAAAGDAQTGGEPLRRALVNAFASSGHGARDGGKTRAALLRRAASFAHRELGDVDEAFRWLGESLVAHVEPETLDELDELAKRVGDPKRSEVALDHALEEVFDGPLVRQLLSRRATLRLEHLDDKAGAATDLKKLHELSPQDHAVMEQLSGLYTDLGDFKALVGLYEDQILRGRDLTLRAELARKVARIWEEQLKDAREAADAWRRVLRMQAGDDEATQGLERAKSKKLKEAEPGAARSAYSPPPAPEGSSPSTAPASLRSPNRPSAAPPPLPARASTPAPATETPTTPPPPAVTEQPDAAEVEQAEASQAEPGAVAAVVEEEIVVAPLETEAEAAAAPSEPAPAITGNDDAASDDQGSPTEAIAAADIPSAPASRARPQGPRIRARRSGSSPFADKSEVLDEEIAASLELLGAEPARPSAPPPPPAADIPVASGSSEALDLDDVELVDDDELIELDDK